MKGNGRGRVFILTIGEQGNERSRFLLIGELVQDGLGRLLEIVAIGLFDAHRRPNQGFELQGALASGLDYIPNFSVVRI